MKVTDLTPAQRIILERCDHTDIVFAPAGQEKVYKNAAKIGLLEKVWGITYKLTAEGKRLKRQVQS